MKVKNQNRIRDEYMTCGICLALAEIASGAEIVEVLENAGITKEFAESCGVDDYDMERSTDTEYLCAASMAKCRYNYFSYKFYSATCCTVRSINRRKTLFWRHVYNLFNKSKF